MRSVYERRIAEASAINGKLLQGDAKLCIGKFGKAWKALFPYKSAEELAARTGYAVRSAAYQISGESELSARCLAALIVEITKRD